jgi:hypothetical protein
MSDLFRAAESGNVRALKAHLRAGKNCNTQTRSTKATPLIWGARKQQTRVIKVLLKCEGINVSIQDSSGNTALHYAARNNDLAIASLLFGAGADLTLKNERAEYAMQLPLDPYNFFKACVLDQHDVTIQTNLANKRLADAKSVITRFEISEALEQVHRLRVEIEEKNMLVKQAVEDENLMNLRLPRVFGAGDHSRVLQDVLFTRLGEVRAEHLIAIKKYERMETIADHHEKQIDLLNSKSIKYTAASEAITEEIEELTAGLAAKTDTLTPLRLYPADENLQEICVAGLVSLIDADNTEAIHQGLSGENCCELIKKIQDRFLNNQKILLDGNRVVKELKLYKSRMYASKMHH